MAKEKEKKTNAMRMLDTAKIDYQVFTYDGEDGLISGADVAKKLNQNPEQVFKTLVTIGEDKNHYVFCIPVLEELDLKACAKVAGVKKVEMLPMKLLLPTTGYIHGGCSPVGMKKKFTTYIDETAILFDTIFVSGGKVGMQVEVGVDDLLQLVDAKLAPLTRK